MGNVQTAASAHEAQWRQAPGGELVDLGRPHRAPLGQLRLQKTPKRFSSRREGVLLAVLVLALHGAVIYWVSQKPTPVLPIVPPEIPPMTLELSRPAPALVEPPTAVPPPPPPVVEPPPPAVDELAAAPAPKKIPKAKPVPKPVAKPVTPPPTPAPQAVAPVAPPAPTPAPAPVTPASANAAYLKNPAPEYPSLAQRRGWEGTVVLRVQVLASGKPGEIQIQKSSGRQQLDDAALAAVKRWSFVPSKRGDVAQDGWVSVPIDFKIH